MITLFDAIFSLDSSIVVIRGEEAFDKDEKPVSYDLEAAKAKLAEMQAAEELAQQQAEAHRQSAIDKLSKLGLTAEEITALGVK